MEVKEKSREMVSGAKNERSKCSTARKKTGDGKKPTSFPGSLLYSGGGEDERTWE